MADRRRRPAAARPALAGDVGAAALTRSPRANRSASGGRARSPSKRARDGRARLRGQTRRRARGRRAGARTASASAAGSSGGDEQAVLAVAGRARGCPETAVVTTGQRRRPSPRRARSGCRRGRRRRATRQGRQNASARRYSASSSAWLIGPASRTRSLEAERRRSGARTSRPCVAVGSPAITASNVDAAVGRSAPHGVDERRRSPSSPRAARRRARRSVPFGRRGARGSVAEQPREVGVQAVVDDGGHGASGASALQVLARWPRCT